MRALVFGGLFILARDQLQLVNEGKGECRKRGYGIRTPGIPINTSVFKTDSFNRSDIHPLRASPALSIRALAGRGLSM